MPTSPILLVDDHADSREVFSTILRHHGFAVVEASDGDAALRVVRTVVPAVVVTGQNMPRLGRRFADPRPEERSRHGLRTRARSDGGCGAGAK